MVKVLGIFLIIMVTSITSYALGPCDAPLLPKPEGRVVVASNTEEIYHAVSKLRSNTTILIKKGTYRLHRPIHITSGSLLKNIAIRGATGRFEDVIIRGAGMNNKDVFHGIFIENVKGLLIANLTIGWVGYHPVTLHPGNCKNVRIFHCRLADAGEQFIKANSDGKGGGVDNCVVEYCTIEYTNRSPKNGYTNGIDVHGGKNWIIRHNLFRNINTRSGATHRYVPAVLMWNGAKNTICEDNTFINCDRAIAFGMTRRKGYHDHKGGVIRNNFIYVEKGALKHADAGIIIWDSPKTKVLNNTIILNGSYPNAIEVRWASTKDVVVKNNLSDCAITVRDGAKIVNKNNITNANPNNFKNKRN